ncbi:MAG: LysM peptidoglycan-binding domain-containing protein [Chloroflexi bacterium]|nr:LysM peptidoglycan-binding domain-containing protein [Chloroflexota bacterium]
MNPRAVSQPVQAVAISAIVLLTLLSAFILTINDRNLNPIGLPSPIGTLMAVVLHTPIGTQVAPPNSLTPGGSTPIATETITPTPTPTLTPTPMCPEPPAGWVQVFYSQAQTPLPLLAQQYNTTVDLLIQVNCLDRLPSQAMQWLYVPSTAPTRAPTRYPVNCYPPPGWPTYIVQWGDTLSRLSARYNVPITWLIQYNCLTSTVIYQGQRLYVPYALPAPTWTLPPPTLTWTPLPSLTWTPTPIVVTPSDTPPPTPTWTPLPIPTDTPEPPVTPTVEVPPTATPTLEPTVTLPPPPTETPVLPTPPTSPLSTPGL